MQKRISKRGKIMNEQKPLTLEQLMKMDGKPVYYKNAKMWFIVCLNHPDFGDCAINASGQYIPLKKAAKQNRFYATELKQLDRSEFKPCEKCHSCFSCKHVVESIGDSPSHCSSCICMDLFEPMIFCPNCGRPLTDKGWDILENKITEKG